MSIPLIKGRIFYARDGANSPPVVIVSETLAKRFFGGEEAVGKGLECGGIALGFAGALGVTRLLSTFCLAFERTIH